MWTWIQQVLGNVTRGELALVAVLSITILMFSWAPKIGEALGGLADPDDEDP
jgi:hypothetical protein